MEFNLNQALPILQRTPRVIRTLLSGLGAEWTQTNYGEDTFSPFDVVGHLITGERTDWLTRTRLILEHGVSQPFPKYDRYAQFEDSRGRTLDELLNTFEQLRSDNLAALAALRLSSEQLSLRGTHPALGVVTLSNLLATWVAHDLNHIAQIAKCMATQYAEAVGPWKAYLGILNSPATKMDESGAQRRRQMTGARH